MHHSRRWNVTTSMAGLKTVTYAQISPEMVNPRDLSAERRGRRRARKRRRRISHIMPLVRCGPLCWTSCFTSMTSPPPSVQAVWLRVVGPEMIEQQQQLHHTFLSDFCHTAIVLSRQSTHLPSLVKCSCCCTNLGVS